MQHWENVHTEEYQGYTINLYTTWEDTEPDWDFESEEDKQELFDKINNGTLLWFIAKVTASKAGVELADDYLGGCCEESIQGFLVNGYFEDMRDNVCSEADRKIKELAA